MKLKILLVFLKQSDLTKRIFITGADGLLGNNLMPILLEKGYSVKAYIQKDKDVHFKKLFPDVNFDIGDILDSNHLTNSCKNFDYLIHAAAVTDIFPFRSEIARKVNIEGTQNIIKAVMNNGINRLIHIGTANSFAYGNIIQPGNETGTYNCAKYKLDYLDTKYEAQQLVLKAVAEDSLPAVIVNPTFMIGPHDYKPSSGTLILAIYHKRVPGYSSGGRNYVYVKDVATAIVNAFDLGKIGECYILGNENLSYKELFHKIACVTKQKAPKIKIPDFAALLMGLFFSAKSKINGKDSGFNLPVARIAIKEHYYNPVKAVKELNMPQTPIDFALDEAFSWLKEHGYLNHQK